MSFYSVASNVYDILDITYFRNKAKNPRSVISELVRREDIRVLDMCCGTLANTIPIAIKHKNSKFYGADISKQMLVKARKKVRQNDIRNIHIKYADCTNIKAADESFDCILIGLALHEMDPVLQGKILKEAHRLLKPDGRLLILEWERPQNFIQRLLFFPLLVAEEFVNRTFMQFYLCDKTEFFKEHRFEMCNVVHCSYSAVMELKKSYKAINDRKLQTGNHIHF